MIPTPEDVTLGEVYRLTLSIIQRLDRMADQAVGRAEYEADAQGNVAAHKELGQRIEAARAEAKDRDDEMRRDLSRQVDSIRRTARWLAGGAGALALSLIVATINHLWR